MMLTKGTPFRIEVPKKFVVMFRSRYLENPAYATGENLQRVLLPWRRLALFVDPPEDAIDFHFDPAPRLADALDVPEGESWDVLARALVAHIQNVGNHMNFREVRRRMFVVNDIHAETYAINTGCPDLSKYEGQVLEAVGTTGNPVRIAVVSDGRLLRPGNHRIDHYQGTPEFHPLVWHLISLMYARETDARFDRMESGDWGLRVGVLGWNLKATSLGALMGQVFSEFPEKFQESRTGVFTDKYGRVCSFYGWPLSSEEVTASAVLCRIMELVGFSGHHRAQAIAANNAVVGMEKEAGVVYEHRKRDVLATLFLFYLYLHPEHWQGVVGALHSEGTKAAIRFGYMEMSKTEDHKLLCDRVLRRANIEV